MKVTPEIAEYAIRYCITRDSYAFEDGLDLAEAFWPLLSPSTRGDLMDAAIERGVEFTNARHPRLLHWRNRLYPQVDNA